MAEEASWYESNSKNLEMIASLKQKGISGEAVAFDWMKRRIQPLQARVTFGFEYQGKKDPSQCLLMLTNVHF